MAFCVRLSGINDKVTRDKIIVNIYSVLFITFIVLDSVQTSFAAALFGLEFDECLSFCFICLYW